MTPAAALLAAAALASAAGLGTHCEGGVCEAELALAEALVADVLTPGDGDDPGHIGMLQRSVAALRANAALGQGYSSPYKLTFKQDLSVLLPPADLQARLGRDPAVLPVPQWYDRSLREKLGPYGPHATRYPAFREGAISADLFQQRVLAVAERFLGTNYQHHHLPQWDPYSHGYVAGPADESPNNWPWIKVSIGRGTAGVDCSNFAAYVFNFAFGIQIPSGIEEEARGTDWRTASGEPFSPKLIPGPHMGEFDPSSKNKPGEIDALLAELQPGDLVYIRSFPEKVVSHVTIWLGEYGTMADGTAARHHLIINSHDNGPAIRDDADVLPPAGVHVLPVRPGEWFYAGFSHALRVPPSAAAA